MSTTPEEIVAWVMKTRRGVRRAAEHFGLPEEEVREAVGDAVVAWMRQTGKGSKQARSHFGIPKGQCLRFARERKTEDERRMEVHQEVVRQAGGWLDYADVADSMGMARGPWTSEVEDVEKAAEQLRRKLNDVERRQRRLPWAEREPWLATEMVRVGGRQGVALEVDCHRLTRPLAVVCAQKALSIGLKGKVSRLRLIVGLGVHSDGEPVLGRAVRKVPRECASRRGIIYLGRKGYIDVFLRAGEVKLPVAVPTKAHPKEGFFGFLMQIWNWLIKT